LRVGYSLEREATLEISAFDIHGRRVVGPVRFTRGAGGGTLELALDDDSRAGLSPGIYEIRINAHSVDGGGDGWVGRQVILR